jgi:hypothetical protein
VLFRAGQRIRVALGGVDCRVFRRIPAVEEVTIHVLAGSQVELPVRQRGEVQLSS